MKLSIVTVNRNNADGLRATLESTFAAQTGFDDWEQIVVDGASTDGSFAAVDPHRGDSRLGWCVSEPDTGIYNAMNKGAAHARGDYLLFLNSGDTLLPDVLAKVFGLSPDADILYGDLAILKKDGEIVKRYPAPRDIHDWHFLYESLPHPATFISRRRFETLGGYDESFRIVSDAKFFLEAVIGGATLSQLPFPVSRFSFGGLSTRPDCRRILIQERIRFLSQFFGKHIASRVTSIPDPDLFLDEETRLALLLDPAFRSFLKDVAKASFSFYREKPDRPAPGGGKHDTGPDDRRLAIEFLNAAAAMRGHPRLALFVRHALHWLARQLRRSTLRATRERKSP